MGSKHCNECIDGFIIDESINCNKRKRGLSFDERRRKIANKRVNGDYDSDVDFNSDIDVEESDENSNESNKFHQEFDLEEIQKYDMNVICEQLGFNGVSCEGKSKPFFSDEYKYVYRTMGTPHNFFSIFYKTDRSIYIGETKEMIRIALLKME